VAQRPATGSVLTRAVTAQGAVITGQAPVGVVRGHAPPHSGVVLVGMPVGDELFLWDVGRWDIDLLDSIPVGGSRAVPDGTVVRTATAPLAGGVRA